MFFLHMGLAMLKNEIWVDRFLGLILKYSYILMGIRSRAQVNCAELRMSYSTKYVKMKICEKNLLTTHSE